MSTKITWDVIHKDFRMRFPHLKKEVVHWHPHDYVTIMLYFSDGRKATYDYLAQRINFTKEKWTHDKK